MWSRFQVDCSNMQMVIRKRIVEKVQVGAAALFTFQRDKAHEVMAVMLDPRYCLGQTFQLVHDDISQAKVLWKRYTDEVLVPTAVTFARVLREQQHSARRQEGPSNDDNRASPCVTGLCDDSDSDVDDGVVDDKELTLKVTTELKLFRKASDLPPFACKQNPLDWWRAHSTLYPSLANLARIVLAVPGSQIECERVFSLAGLMTSHLRNKMSPERLDVVVLLSKNLDLDEALEAELAPVYGGRAWEMSKDTMGSLPECAQSEVEMCGHEFEGGVNWHVLQSLLEEEEGLEPMM